VEEDQGKTTTQEIVANTANLDSYNYFAQQQENDRFYRRQTALSLAVTSFGQNGAPTDEAVINRAESLLNWTEQK
jgi:hypothetical protein